MSVAWMEWLRFLGGRRLPNVLQSEASECGLACLAMICGYYGHKTDLGALRREYAISLKGATLRSLMDIAHRLGFTCRALRLELDELAQLQGPAILHWNLDHFVVLAAVRRDSVLIHDPARGPRRVSLHAASEHFSGVAVELRRAPGFRPKDERDKLSLRELWRGATGLKRFVARLLALSIVLQGMALLTPFYVQLVVDEAVVRSDTTFLALLAMGCFAVIALQTALGWLRSWAVMYLGTLLSIQVQGNLFRHLLGLPLRFFQTRHIGDIVSRFGSMSAVQNLLTTGLIEAVVDGLLVTFTLAVMILYQPMLAAIAGSLLLLYAFIRWARYHALRELSLENVVAAAENNSHFMETIRGMSTVKLFGLEHERIGQWQNRVIDVANTSIRIARLNLGFGVINKLLFGAAHVGVVYLGASLVMEQSLTVGMLIAFLSYQGQFLAAGGGLVDQWIAYKLLDVHLDRLSDIALTRAEEERAPAQLAPHASPSSFAFDRVAFRYAAGEPWLFADVTLEVPSGSCAVIVGASGAGKSTLLRLALGLERPGEGTVRFGGADVARLGLCNYRRVIAAVTQEDRLFTGSIAENITLFDTRPDLEWMTECARLCAIDDTIMRMPMNYHSLIGDMGDALSAGERQRLMLARALYRRPKLLLLDEATSNLDHRLDARINEMLASLRITRLVVSHRDTALQYAGSVYELAHGTLTPFSSTARMAATA